MEYFKNRLKDINQVLNDILVFEVILNSILIYLVVYLILMFTDISSLYALVPSLAYLLYATYQQLKKNKLIMVEKRYKFLNEKLRTAADNIHINNPIVKQLQLEVLNDLKKVYASTFMKPKQSSFKIFFAVVLSFVIILLAAHNIEFINIKGALKTPAQFRFGFGGVGNESGGNVAGVNGGNNNIYGQESIAQAGEEELQLNVPSFGFEITNIRDENKPEEEFEEFPSEITKLKECVEPPCVLEDNIPVERHELVKNYFLILAQK